MNLLLKVSRFFHDLQVYIYIYICKANMATGDGKDRDET